MLWCPRAVASPQSPQPDRAAPRIATGPDVFASRAAQFYSADVSEYLYAVEHMLQCVQHLAEGGRKLDKWERLIFRDVLAAVMCAPGQKKKTMRPTRSARPQLVRNPNDRTRDVTIELSYNNLWWSAPPAKWRKRSRDYLEPVRVARRIAWGDKFRAAEAAEDAAADATAAAASRARADLNRRRFERDRASVRSLLAPDAA